MNAIEQAIQTAQLQPWQAAEMPVGYEIRSQGVFLKATSEDKLDDHLSGPVWVSAQNRSLKGDNWGVLLEWIDQGGHHRELPFSRSRLYEPGNQLIPELAGLGLWIMPGKTKKLMDYFQSCNPAARYRNVDRLGWVEDLPVFVMPQQVIALDGNKERFVFQPERYAPTAQTVNSKGTLAEWQDQVAAMAQGNPYLLFAIALALSGPLLKWARLDSGGFHVYGQSSRGKTTLAQVAASVWGCGADPAHEPGQSFIRRWNTTTNGLEGLASAHNDLLLILDEWGTFTGKDFGSVVYNLAGGQGKTSMDANRNLKAQRHFLLQVLSTGEIPTRHKLEEERKQARAGQMIRLIDLPIVEPSILANVGACDSAQYCQRLKKAAGSYYGTAGLAFVETLIKQDLDTLIPYRLQQAEQALMLDGLQPEAQRAIRRFALVLVAGQMAIEWNILPIEVEEFQQAMALMRDAWLTESAALNDAVRSMISVRDFMMRHQASRFGQAFSDYRGNEPLTIRDQVGYILPVPKGGLQHYLFTPEGFKEACGGFDPRQVAQALKENGLLYTEKGRLTYKCQIQSLGGKRPHFYAVNAALLEKHWDRWDIGTQVAENEAGKEIEPGPVVIPF